MNMLYVLGAVTVATVAMNGMGMVLSPGKGAGQTAKVNKVYHTELAKHELNADQLELAEWCLNSAQLRTDRKGAASVANYCICNSVETTKYAPAIRPAMTLVFKSFFVPDEQAPDLSTQQAKSDFLNKLRISNEFKALTEEQIAIAGRGSKRVAQICAPKMHGETYTR